MSTLAAGCQCVHFGQAQLGLCAHCPGSADAAWVRAGSNYAGLMEGRQLQCQRRTCKCCSGVHCPTAEDIKTKTSLAQGSTRHPCATVATLPVHYAHHVAVLDRNDKLLKEAPGLILVD